MSANAITIHAVFVGGIFKPVERLDLPEGAAVELQIVRQAARAAAPNTFGRLAGKLSYLSDEIVADVEHELAAMRRQIADRLARIAVN